MKEKKSIIRKNDILLIIAVLVVAMLFGSIMMLTRSEGGTAVIIKDGNEIQRLSLDRDTEYVVGEGKDLNKVVIRDGKAYVSEAGCPDKICVKTGAVCYEGETIVCLPNKLVVRIEGGETSSVDAIVQ